MRHFEKQTKVIIISLCVLAVITTGATGAYYANKPTTERTTEETMSAKEIDVAVQEGLTKIDEAVTTAISQIETTKSQTTDPTTTKYVVTETMAYPEPIVVPLNVTTLSDFATIRITSARFSYEYNTLYMTYDVEYKVETRPQNDMTRTTCFDKTGRQLRYVTFGDSGNKGTIIFSHITDPADLSTITLTYAFEGYDPVTVTIDIPIQ